MIAPMMNSCVLSISFSYSDTQSVAIGRASYPVFSHGADNASPMAGIKAGLTT